MSAEAVTLYQLADAEIRRCIESYLALAKATSGLSVITAKDVAEPRTRAILLAGLGVSPDIAGTASDLETVEEWKRRQAIPFSLEDGITFGVYRDIRGASVTFLDSVETATDGFTKFDADYIQANPNTLPIFQHVAGDFSKSALTKEIGSASDVSISKPAAAKLAKLLSDRVKPGTINKGEILQRVESTLEGIVRDLIGRVLFESIVDSALKDVGVKFLRENEYSALEGVVYNFRADFVLPDAVKPKVFIEVRKSSSRHASLYAKDKMFSAINWKGKTQDLLGVLIVDGEWTGETLKVMANVFDYVVPIGRVAELAETVKAYVDGDTSKLKWLIEFKIVAANHQKK